MELLRPSKLTAIVLVLIPFASGYYNNGNDGLSSWLSSANDYSSMGDIAWKKRNIGSYMRQSKRFDSPSWGYASMADADWGWKKRAAPSYDPKDLYDYYKTQKKTSDYWKRFGQSYYLPYTAYQPYNNRNSYYGGGSGSSSYYTKPVVAKSQQRNRNGDRQYNYHSMADVDWGWKRKRSGPVVEPATDAEYDAAIEKIMKQLEDTDQVEKKNIASLVRNNDMYKRSESEEREGDDSDIMLEEKRHLGSVMNRQTRNGGISALARHGYLPNIKH